MLRKTRPQEVQTTVRRTSELKTLRNDIRGCGLYGVDWLDVRYEMAASPHVDGAKLVAHWSRLEPREGEYDWRPFDEHVERWRSLGKRVMLSVVTADHAAAGHSATPQWVFDAGARRVESVAMDGVTRTGFPVFWDEIYLEKYARFVEAFGKHYDRTGGVEAVQIGVGHYGEAMVADQIRDTTLAEWPAFQAEKEAWLEAGLSLVGWVDTVRSVIDLHVSAFPSTPLILLLCDPALDYAEKAIPRYMQYAAERQIILQNCGVSALPVFGYRGWMLPMIGSLRDRTSVAYETVAPCEEACEAKPADANFAGLPPGFFVAKGTLSEVIDAMLREESSYATFWSSDLELGTPGSPIYLPGYEKQLERLRKALRPGASGPSGSMTNATS